MGGLMTREESVKRFEENLNDWISNKYGYVDNNSFEESLHHYAVKIWRVGVLLAKPVMSMHSYGLPTKRAVDVWNSAAFTSSFLASSFSCSQTESTPTPAPVTQTVRWLVKSQTKGVHMMSEW
jgi:hypothetical protein